jgi:starch-binding outer membrane protein, SusD/RagB family
MKRILIIILVIASLASCKKSSDFLDGQAISLNENMVFTDSARTMAFLTGIYADLGFSFTKGRWDSHGNTEQATDDAEYTLSGTGQAAVILYNGSISPTAYTAQQRLLDFWNLPYTNIRRVNLLLSKLSSTPLSPAMQSRVKGEARFLRAYFYVQLMVCFGGVPNIGDNVFGKDDIINIPRQDFGEFVDYIVNELDEAAALVPVAYPDDIDYGRITSGACKALKARALLYAASPLFNGGSISTNGELTPLVSYPVASDAHWQRAADAANDVITSGNYSLHTEVTPQGNGFYNVFLRRVNNEYILGFYRAPNRDFEGYYNPRTRSGSTNRSLPTQDLVDCFPMQDGLQPFNPDGTINVASGYSATDPYVNREPRFYYSIIYNGSLYTNNSGSNLSPVYTFVNGTGTIPAPTQTIDAFNAGTTTGYFSRKMCDVTISANSGANADRAWPLIRYAEMLLSYAEAINEAGQTELAVEKIIELRQRAGITPGADNRYGIKAGITKEEMRDLVRNERRIELAFEDHRWHDIRRWKIAMVTNNQFNKVMRITKNSNGSYTYDRLESIRRHNFRPEMYLLPIPDPEIQKMPAMIQNPGW